MSPVVKLHIAPKTMGKWFSQYSKTIIWLIKEDLQGTHEQMSSLSCYLLTQMKISTFISELHLFCYLQPWRPILRFKWLYRIYNRVVYILLLFVNFRLYTLYVCNIHNKEYTLCNAYVLHACNIYDIVDTWNSLPQRASW